MEQERLLTIIERAIDLYQLCQPIKGMLPSAHTLANILKTCGCAVEYDRIQRCREMVISGKVQESQVRQGECVECGRFSSQLTAKGYCEGCVMQAMIDAMEP